MLKLTGKMMFTQKNVHKYDQLFDLAIKNKNRSNVKRYYRFEQ